MPVFDLLGVQIDYQHIVSTDSDRFEAGNEIKMVLRLRCLNIAVMVFLIMRQSFFHDGEVTVIDFKLVGPMNQEAILKWVLLIYLKDIISQLAIPLVSKDIEALIVRGDSLDTRNLSLFVNIEFLNVGIGQVYIHCFILGAKNEFVLRFAQNRENRCMFKGYIK